jgi:hypothetical protein
MNKEGSFFKCEGSALALPGFIAFGRNGSKHLAGDSTPPAIPATGVGARVASLRCPVFRPGTDQYMSGNFRLWKNPLPDVRLTGYK